METTLGKLIDGPAGRDAIHMACAPMIADCDLEPGENIGIVRDGVAGKCEPHVGIADPFLKEKVVKGQRFWLIAYPKSVTGIRHHWTHPAFQDVPEDVMAAREWVVAFAARWNYSFDEFMAGAHDYVRGGNELDDKWVQLDVPENDWTTFWTHFKTLTGVSNDDDEPKEFVKCCPN